MDTLTTAERSARMALIRSTNTKPEIAVRRITHSLGFRFRLHRRDLPGAPDLVFPRLKCVVFVHGCFWHRHPYCSDGTRIPKSRVAFWRKKFQGNKRRDTVNAQRLRRLHWRVLTIWECELRQPARVASRLSRFLTTANQLL